MTVAIETSSSSPNIIKLREILHDVSRSASTHRKNLGALLKVQKKIGGDFPEQLQNILLLILSAPKGNSEADRVVKFLVEYVRALNNHDDPEIRKTSVELTQVLIPTLLGGFEAANKSVRYRCCQVVALLLNDLEEIDEDMFRWIQRKFIDRTKDKDAPVRVQASFALCRIQNAGDDKENQFITQTLVQMLSSDSSADVRKTILWNIQITDETLPAVLARIRDVDASIRRLSFTRLLKDGSEVSPLLVPQTRDWILSSGLNDRDQNVRTACLKLLISGWIAECNNNLLEFLEIIDIHEGKTSAELALTAFFNESHDAKIDFNDIKWDDLSAHGAFLLLVYTRHQAKSNDAILDELPSLSDLVKSLTHYSHLLSNPELEEARRMDGEYVLHQLLLLVTLMDLSDELGRSRLIQFICEMMSFTDVPDKTIALGSQLLLKCHPDIYEFLSVVKKVLEDVGSNNSAEDEDSDLLKQINQLKQLEILQSAFSLTQKISQVAEVVYELLEMYVFPAMSSLKQAIRRAALECLALCCLHDVTLAEANIELFVGICQDPKLGDSSFKALVDVIMLRGYEFLKENQQEQFLQILQSRLEGEDADALTVTVLAVCKLLLLKRLADDQILNALVVLYFHPNTAQVHQIRQYLSYFFPVYCGSSSEHAEALVRIFVPCMGLLVDFYEQYSGKEMIQPLQMGSQLLGWMDYLIRPENESSQGAVDTLHTSLFHNILNEAPRVAAATRRTFCQIIPKLRLSTEMSEDIITQVENLKESVLHDQVAATALKRFLKSVTVEDAAEENS